VLELNVIPVTQDGDEVVTHIWSLESKVAPLGHAGFDLQRFIEESNVAVGDEHIGDDESTQLWFVASYEPDEHWGGISHFPVARSSGAIAGHVAEDD